MPEGASKAENSLQDVVVDGPQLATTPPNEAGHAVPGASPQGQQPQEGELRECRICLEADNQEDLVQPCKCAGTAQWAHMECLRSWAVESLSLKCEICGSVFTAPVVAALMDTLCAAQDRDLAARGIMRMPPTEAVPTFGLAVPAGPQRDAEAHAFLQQLMHTYAAQREQVSRERAEAFAVALRRRRRIYSLTYCIVALLVIIYVSLLLTLGRTGSSRGSSGSLSVGLRVVMFIIPIMMVMILFNYMRLRQQRIRARALAPAPGIDHHRPRILRVIV